MGKADEVGKQVDGFNEEPPTCRLLGGGSSPMSCCKESGKLRRWAEVNILPLTLRFITKMRCVY